MKFKYTPISSPNEVLGIVNASSQKEAELIASQIKKLPLDKFLKLFKVKEYEK